MNLIGNIFCGQLPAPCELLTPDRQDRLSDGSLTIREIEDTMSSFMNDGWDFAQFDRQGSQDEAFLNALGENGLFGLTLPSQFGGFALNNLQYGMALRKIASHDISSALTVGAHASIGLKALVLFGTAAQKEKYYPRLASGEMIAAYCLTEAGAGSNPKEMKSRAVKQADGSWLLTGEKIYITNGPIAKFFTVFAKTSDDDLSAFIVERDWENVDVGSSEDKMGIRGSATSTVSFQAVVVPAENLIGEEGRGFEYAMAVLYNGRTGLVGGIVGSLDDICALSFEYAEQREQRGKINKHGLVQEKLVDIRESQYVTESLLYALAYQLDLTEDAGGDGFGAFASAAKVYAAESLGKAVDDALQIHAGSGFMEGPVARHYRDARIARIYEGTSQVLSLLVTRSGLEELGGAMRPLAKHRKGQLLLVSGKLSWFSSKEFSRAIFGPLKKEAVKLEKQARLLSSEAMSYLIEEIKARKKEKKLREAGKTVPDRIALEDRQILLNTFGQIAIKISVGYVALSRLHSLGSDVSQSERDLVLRFLRKTNQGISHDFGSIRNGYIEQEDEKLGSLVDGAYEFLRQAKHS